MKFSTRDLLFVGINTLIIMIAGSLLYADFSSRIDVGNRTPVGTIVFKRKTAERKYSGQVIWEDVASRTSVFDRDTIRTAEDSQAILTLKDGTKLELDQNTLIVVSVSKKGTQIGFSRGGLATSRTGGSGTVHIATGSGEVALGDGAVALQSSSSNRMAVQVLSGSAELRSLSGKAGAASKTLQAGSAAEVVGDAVQVDPDPVIVQSPANGAYLIATGKTVNVDFKWKQAGNVLLEYGTGMQLKQAKRVKLSGTAYQTALPEGMYYWRVVKTAGGKNGAVRRFTVLHEKPSRLLDPVQNSVFPVKPGISPLIRFSWTPAERAVSWQLEVATDRTFLSKVRRYTANFNEISIDDLQAGKWYWRLRHRYGFENKNPVYSQIGSFEIRTVKELPKPEPATAGNNAVTALQQKQSPVTVSWSDKFSLYSAYRVEFSRTADFKSVFKKVDTTAQFARVEEQLDNGTYFWRVRGVTANGKSGAPSAAATVKIVPVQPVNLTGPSLDALLDLKGGGKVHFSWQDPNHAANYMLRIARDKEMKNAESVRLIKPFFNKEFKQGGLVYWQVAVLDKGKPVKWSSVHRFRMAGKLAGVVTTTPADNQEIDIQNMREIVFGWNPVAGADQYRFRLFYFNGRFEKEVFSSSVKKTQFRFKAFDKLQRGTFYWTVQAEQLLNGEIVSRSPLQRHFIRIKLRRIKRAPVLIMPGVFYVD